MRQGEPEYRRRIRQNTENKQQESDRERDKAEQRQGIERLFAAISSIEQQQHRADDERKRERKCDRLWERAGVIALAAAAMVGVAAIYIGNSDSAKQRGVMQGQLDEMHNEQRPWVGLDGIIYIDALETSPRLRVESHYQIKNFGHAPAFKVISDGFFWTDPNMLAFVAKAMCSSAKAFATGTVPMPPKMKNPGPFGYLLFPSQGQTETIGSKDEPLQGAAQTNMRSFWFIGCVAYIDQFKTVHWTRFCMQPEHAATFPFTKDTPLRFCSLYNDTDDSEQPSNAGHQ